MLPHLRKKMIRFDDFLNDVDFGEASTNEKKLKNNSFNHFICVKNDSV